MRHTGSFKPPYLAASFFDRYLYVDEVKEQDSLKASAHEKFELNVLRGWSFNAALEERDVSRVTNSVLEEAARICHRVLGSFDETEVFESVRHGPNATTTLRKSEAYLDVKAEDFCGTASALEVFYEHYLPWDSTLAREMSYYLPPPGAVGPEVAENSVVELVPKKWNSLRFITKVPTLNMFFQLGTGGVIAGRLKRFCNIDLKTQQDVHRKLCLLASKHPEIMRATIDWSEASDRMWLRLLQWLLPPDWYEWLQMVRVPTCVVEDSAVRHSLPMIGTMGEGFTFPLQTLVFYSILSGVCRTYGFDEDVSVFGDDCICDSRAVPYIMDVAREIGWQMNADKSYVEGPFRESCGEDGFRGLTTRPFFIERPDGISRKRELQAWTYVCYNGMRSRLGISETPHLDKWLLDLHARYELGAILQVPPFYSDSSGIQVEKPLKKEGFATVETFRQREVVVRRPYTRLFLEGGELKYSREFSTETQQVEDAAYFFRALINTPPKRHVRSEWSYYVASLGGPSVAPPFKLKYMEEVPMGSLDSQGRCPLKTTRVVSKEQRVLTWNP
jgi:hypothetical protein